LKNWLLEAVQKVPDARQAKSRGMRQDFSSAAVTKDECNAADGRFSTASRGEKEMPMEEALGVDSSLRSSPSPESEGVDLSKGDAS
jgi:hypothetical protein